MAYAPENGDAWIDKTLSELKYRINDQNRSLHPTPWYVAGEAISEGDLVSICDQVWHDANGSLDIGKVYLTDSAFVDRCLGIALNNATVDEPIEVLSWGVYKFSVAPFVVSDIGKMAYIKVTPEGSFTTNRNEATLGGNTLIEIGTVVATDELLVSFEGDSRGPAGITEIEYLAGTSLSTNVANNPLLLSQAYETTQGKTIGSIYPADKNKVLRKTTIAGFAIGASDVNFGTAIPIAQGSKVICQRQGLCGGFTGLVPGMAVYAATNGQITQSIASLNFYTDAICPVGIAYSETSVLVNIESSIYNIDTAPVGTIIALPPTGGPDYGYLECNGAVLSAVANPEYAELYDVIKNTWGGTGDTDFELPNLGAVETTGFQIKYKVFYQAIPSDTPVFRIDTEWATYTHPAAALDISINAWGEAFDLDEAVIKLFIKDGTTTRLLEPTPTKYTNHGTGVYYEYGYQAVKLDADVDHIRILFAPDGLAYLSDAGEWTSASGQEFKVVIYKAEKWNRFIDITAETKLNTLFEQGLVTRNKTTTTKVAGEIDRGTVDPTNTTRLNYDGNLYVNNLLASGNLYAKGQEVVLNNETGTAPTDVLADLSGIRVKGDTDKTIIWKNADDSWHLNQKIKLNTDDGVTNKLILDNDTGDISSEGNATLKGNLNIKRPDRSSSLWARYSAESLGDLPKRSATTFFESSTVNPTLGSSWTASNCSISNGYILSCSGASAYIFKGASLNTASFPLIKIKLRKIKGTTTAVSISSAGVTGSPVVFTLKAGDKWQTLHAAHSWTGTGTDIRLTFTGSSNGDVFEIAYIAVLNTSDDKKIPSLALDTSLGWRRSLTSVTPIIEPGYKERAFRFSGAQNSRLYSEVATRGFTDGSFSIHCVLKHDDDTPASSETIFNYGDGTRGFDIFFNTSGQLNLSFRTGNTYTTTTKVADTSFYTLDVIVNRAGTNLSVYKNSVLVQSFSIVIPAGCTNIDQHNLNLTIGAYFTPSNLFKGLLENLQIYTSALSLEEIKALYYLEEPKDHIWIRDENQVRANEEFINVRNLTATEGLAIGYPTAFNVSQKSLRVAGATELNSTLQVVGANATTLGGTLGVTGATTLNNTLSVVGAYATTLGGTLGVTGAATLSSTLTVGGSGTLVGGSSSPSGATALAYNGYFYGARVYGAVWNDIADFIEVDADFKGTAGKAYVRTEEGLVRESTRRAQRGSIGIYSDTFGLTAGQDPSKNQIPIAVGGWALVYVSGRVEVGDALVSGPNGCLIKASFFDRLLHPERILAIYDRKETAEMWPENNENAIQVDNRVWVKVK